MPAKYRIAPVALAALLVAASAWADDDLVTVTSPNGQIEFDMFLTRQPDPSEPLVRLAYQVRFKGKLLIDTSFMGLNIRDQPILGVNVGMMKAKKASVDQTYTLVAGKAKTVRDHYNSVTAEYLQNGSLGRQISVEARAYDDGIAFRYLIPWSNQMADAMIDDEFTEFQFAKDGTAYPRMVRDYSTPVQDVYSRLPLSAIHEDSLIALPFLVEQPGVGWVAVTEADVDNYAGMYLKHEEGRAMISTLTPRTDNNTTAVLEKAPSACPWRVLLIGSEPGRLIESNLVKILNPPSAIADTSWIKPGKASRVEFKPGMSTEAIERWIDFAAASKLEYMLLDGEWATSTSRDLPADITRPVSGIDMPEILRYAKTKNVGLWLTADWTAVQLRMDAAFALFEKWGVAGVRIDGMNRDDQWMVNYYHQIAKAAAEHHLLLDFHGTGRPDGLSRTWPNVLTRDAVAGSAMDRENAQANPDQDAVLAFTRTLAGPMDYAPGGFDNVTAAAFEPREIKPMTMGTRAHQLALYVVFESPLETVPDDPDVYQGQKEVEFIQDVPASWDETRVVSGKVGEYAAIARRKGSQWFLGGITNWDAREVDVPLEFLGSGEYTAEIYSDAPEAAGDPRHTNIDKRRVTAATVLKLNLAPGGGVAIRFSPAS